MKTIKLPIQNHIEIEPLMKTYSSCVRFSYNRFLESKTEKEIRLIIKDKFPIGSWLQQCAIKQAQSIYESQQALKIPKLIFGSKKRFKEVSKGTMSKEEWKNSRLCDIRISGEAPQKGNRMVNLNILNNNQIVFKESKSKHHIIQLPRLRKNIKSELTSLELASQNKELAFMISLNKTHISITFDEAKLTNNKYGQMKNRILGIDLNPNYIGISIIQFSTDDSFEIIHKEVIDVSKLNVKNNNKGKKHFELYQITSHISKLAKHYLVGKMAIEELNIKSSNKGKGRNFNRLCNNEWNRELTVQSLKKHCNYLGIVLVEVNPAYSSTIGNLLYANENTPDMVASSIEVARRGYKKYVKGWFYPKLELLKNKGNQWKEELCSRFTNWIEIHQEIKNSKMKYRVLLNDCNYAVYRFSSQKSCINLYNFV